MNNPFNAISQSQRPILLAIARWLVLWIIIKECTPSTIEGEMMQLSD